MYGVVLMAALATSSSAPDWCHRSCCGSYGYGCYGCYGGCYGCYGGCWGGYGGCYGCWGGYGGCGGYGFAASPYSVWGCYGGMYGAGCTGCYGCYGGYSCYGVPFPGGTTYGSPGMTNPVPPANDGTPVPEVTPPPKVTPGKEQTRAKVRIELPADAKLYVDGQLMKTDSAVRHFHTPDLNPGQTYFYDLKAVIVRDGRTYSDNQQILVRAGTQTTASFAGLEQRAQAASQGTPAIASSTQR